MKFKLLYDKIDKFIYNLGYSLLGSYFERNQINEKQVKKLYENIKLTNQEKNKIDKFYKENYGKKIPYNWHKFYQSYNGKYDEKYFPELLYIPKFELKMNPKNYCRVFEDKNIQYLLTKNTNIKLPKSIISQSDGIYRDSESNIIDYVKAEKILDDYSQEMFLKPSKNSDSGRNCKVISIRKGKETKSGKEIKKLLEEYNGNFCIQERLKNSELLSKLHPESINTFRVMTYIWKEKIYHCPVTVRIGMGKANVDNGHAGGMFVGIDDLGNFCEKGFTLQGEKFKEHPNTNIKFKGYKIPQIKEIIKAAEKLHSNIVQIGIISWDLTIDEKGDIVLIEINPRGGSLWLPQISHGCGAFGENTASILKWISKN